MDLVPVRETAVFAFCRKTALIPQSGLFGPKTLFFGPKSFFVASLKINCYNHDGNLKDNLLALTALQARWSLGSRHVLFEPKIGPQI